MGDKGIFRKLIPLLARPEGIPGCDCCDGGFSLTNRGS